MKAKIAPLVLVGVALACSEDPTIIQPPPTELSCSVPEDLFFQGQVTDGIPSLTTPGIATVATSEPTLTDDERVLGMVVNGVPRAYPLAILRWHEIVNDTLGGERILVSYCPLTASGIAFNPSIDGGAAKNFGVSGLLFENNLVMYDRQTNSLWIQMMLGSQCGPERGKALERIPVIETTWRHWKESYPETTVLNFRTGFIDRDYNANPYASYMLEDDLFYPSAPFSDDRDAKEFVFGVFSDDAAVVFPFGVLGEGTSYGIRNDTVGDIPFLVTYVTDDESATAFDRRVNGQELTFSTLSVAQRTVQDTETGSTWNEFGEAIGGQLVGEQLTRINDAFMAYWFAWSVYYPDLRLGT